MKKIYGIIVVALGMVSFSSCSDYKFDSSAYTNGIKVTSAEGTIDAAGGSVNIEVDKTISKAYAADGWLSVTTDGQKVIATAEKNRSRESRSSIVVVKASDTDSTIVNVSQLGLVFGCDASDMTIGDGACVKSFNVTNNSGFSITGFPSWIELSATESSVTMNITENTTGHVRSGYVYVQSGEYTDSICIRQGDFKDVATDYYMYYYAKNSSTGKYDLTYDKVQIYASQGDTIMSFPGYRFKWPCSYDAQNIRIKFSNMYKLGTYMGYTIYGMVINGAGYLSYSTAYSGWWDFDTTEDGIGFANLGTDYGTDEPYGLDFYAFSGSTAAGTLQLFTYPQLIRVDDLEALGAKENKEARISKFIKRPQTTFSSPKFDGK